MLGLYTRSQVILFCYLFFPFPNLSFCFILFHCNSHHFVLKKGGGVNFRSNTFFYKIRSDKKANFRWKTCKILIIDEISMIDGAYLDALNSVAKSIRGSTLPFGGLLFFILLLIFISVIIMNKGIQVIFCGDFLQL